MQEDKRIVFSTVDRTRACILATTHLMRAMEFYTQRMGEAARHGASWATDLAELLVSRSVPFRDAHEATGRLVATLEERNLDLADADEALLKEHHAAFEASDVAWADPRASVGARAGHGGPAPGRVREQLEILRRRTTVLRDGTS